MCLLGRLAIASESIGASSDYKLLLNANIDFKAVIQFNYFLDKSDMFNVLVFEIKEQNYYLIILWYLFRNDPYNFVD